MSLERAVERGLRILVAPALLVLIASGQTSEAAEPRTRTASLVVHADREGPKVSPLLWGIFFEDINCSADGGIYAELVRNRSFENSDKPEHWKVTSVGEGKAEATIDTSRPISPRNRRSLKVTVDNPAGAVGIVNEGYWGVPVKNGEEYRLTLRARGVGVLGSSLIIAVVIRKGDAVVIPRPST